MQQIIGYLKKDKWDLIMGAIKRDHHTSKRELTLRSIDTDGEKMIVRKHYLTLGEKSLWFADGSWINRAPHGRFVKKELADSCLFDEQYAIAEDVLWNFNLLERAQKVAILQGGVYHYSLNSTSATQRYRENFSVELHDILKAYRDICYVQYPELSKYYDLAAHEYFNIFMRVYICPRENKWTITQKVKHVKEEVTDNGWLDIFKRARNEKLSWKQKLLVMLGGNKHFLLLTLLYDIKHRKLLMGLRI